jgi:hypothetical protein
MSGTGQTAIPGPLVDNDPELIHLMYVYGRDAARAGFRAKNEPPVIAKVMQHSLCATTTGPSQYNHCGPFRTDFYTQPLWTPVKDQDITDLPPR